MYQLFFYSKANSTGALLQPTSASRPSQPQQASPRSIPNNGPASVAIANGNRLEQGPATGPGGPVPAPRPQPQTSPRPGPQPPRLENILIMELSPLNSHNLPLFRSQQVNNINPNMSLADKTEAVIRDLQEDDTMSNLKKTFAGIFGEM